MASSIARAHFLAAQITAATGASAEVGQAGDGVTVRVELPAGVPARNWDAVLLALLNLPVSDRIGGERSADGTVQLWAFLLDDSSLETM